MSDPGLAHRLRQRSRRAGLMIGLSMLLTIALCAVAFTMIYSALDGFTDDFISTDDEETATVEPLVAQDTNSQEPANTTGEESGEAQSEQDQQAADPTEAPPPEPTATAAPEEENGADDGEFDPDYQLRGVTVNLRSGPSTSTDIVTALPPSTPLEYLDEDAPTDSPEDGERWMRFATEEGLEGWIREIDVNEFQP